MAASLATTAAFGCMCATATWIFSIAESGVEVIIEIAAARRRVVHQVGLASTRALESYADLRGQLLEQAGGVACPLMVLTAVAFQAKFPFDFMGRMGRLEE